MSFARKFLLFSYGLFTIAAQTLLFREFLTNLEGNDICVAVFFASWFFWVAAGSILLYKFTADDKTVQIKIELLFLAYLPALLLQMLLIIHARTIFREPPFLLLPIRTILLLSLLVNAPVSLITGLLFPLVCRWIRQFDSAPISRVYIIEAAGSFAGGIAVTILLAAGASQIQICFLLALLVSISILLLHLYKPADGGLVFLLPACIILCLVFSIDKKISHSLQTTKWNRLTRSEPATTGTLAGSFQTSQAEYLYGSYKNQFLSVSQAAVVEAMPDDETNGRIAALALCQNPDAKNILVIGTGLDLCRQFLKLKQTQTVCWSYPDSEYIRKINSALPANLQISGSLSANLKFVTGEIRSFLAANKQSFDIVILNLPDPATSALNRYFTVQFFKQIKNSLRTGGIVAIRISGGENIMAAEITDLGASVKLTLEGVFSNLVLAPGGQTWFVASDSAAITGRPGILRDQFRKIDGSDAILPPDALLSIYLSDRAEKAVAAYDNPDISKKLLVNTDSKPLTFLFSLLLSAKQSGVSVSKFIKMLIPPGIIIFLIPVIVFAAVRLLYIFEKLRPNKMQFGSPHNDIRTTNYDTFDSSFLAFSAGATGIGSCIILMYLYQTQFGSLYLHIGIISSLFMLGLFFGAALVRFLLKKTEGRLFEILLAAVCIHALLLAAIPAGVDRLTKQWSSLSPEQTIIYDPVHLIFAAAFLFCGLCAGAYFPIAAKQFSDTAAATGTAASYLETADHVGAAAGSLLTGLLLVPILGITNALVFFIILILANIPPAVLKKYRHAEILPMSKTIHRTTRFGFVLFAVALTVILCSNILFFRPTVRQTQPAAVASFASLPQQTAESLAGALKIQPVSVQLSQEIAGYYKIYDSNERLAGFIFSSENFAPQISGFGGKINLAIFIDPAGKLLDFQIITSNETPEYLKKVIDKKNLLLGKYLFNRQPFSQTDAVTGATISYNAIIASLQTSAQEFARQELDKNKPSAETKETAVARPFDYAALFLAAAIAASLIIISLGGYKIRLAILLINFIVAGVLFNAQYSLVQVSNLLTLNLPAVAFGVAFLITAIVPVLVIIFGNIYCGYLCPFGALQELVGSVVPRRLKTSVPASISRNLTFVKYLLLFIFIIAFFVSRNQSTLSSDPLVSIFSRSITPYIITIAIVALAGSLFYTRLFCRFLCPTGAFLSILNRIAIFKKFLSPKRFRLRKSNITPAVQTDCIYRDPPKADRHLPEKITGIQKPPAKTLSSYILITVVAAAAIFISFATIRNFKNAFSAELIEPQNVQSAAPSSGNIDVQNIRSLIHQNKLSNREALFYNRLDGQNTKKTDQNSQPQPAGGRQTP